MSESLREKTGNRSDHAGDGRFNVWLMLPVIIFVGFAIVFGFALQTGDPSKIPSALVGKSVPRYDFPAMAGLVAKDGHVPGVRAADLGQGQVTVLNFWASWCVPCIQEHPVLVALGQRANVRMIGINYKDPSPAGRRFLGRYGNPFAAVGIDANGRGAIEWGVYGMPETFVIDGAGRIVHKHVGPLSMDDLDKTIIPAVEAARKATAGKS